MTIIKRFEEMEVWKLVRELTQCLYSISNNRLSSRDVGLREQIRRASIGIVSNIAGGFGSRSNPSFRRFQAAARGSTAEIRAQLYPACDLGYIL
jgi:four helix bundle protein